MPFVSSLSWVGKPAAKRSRAKIVNDPVSGIELQVCRTAPVAVSNSSCNRVDAHSFEHREESFEACGWCGCSSGCSCGEMMDNCAHSGGIFEVLQLEDIATDKKLDSVDDWCGASHDTVSVFDSADGSFDVASEPTPSEEPGCWESASDDATPRQVPDFSGRWAFKRFEGDFDGMMADAGVHWTIRRLARGANYGVGMLFQDISQQGDHITINFNNHTSVSTMELRVGLTDQATRNEAGEPVVMSASWEGTALHLAGARAKDGRRMQDTFRYMQGQEMVLETRVSCGKVLRRFYAQ